MKRTAGDLRGYQHPALAVLPGQPHVSSGRVVPEGQRSGLHQLLDCNGIPLQHRCARAQVAVVSVVKDADFTIEAKSFVAFVGPSGSGKSTLLNMIGCLDHPTGGKLTVLDTDVGSLNRRSAAHFRGSHIGFVFQDFNLRGSKASSRA